MNNLERIQEILTRDESDRKIIRFKEECYALYEEGLLGNKPLTWNSYDEIIKSGWKGEVCMRSKKMLGVKRNQTTYNVPLEKIPDEIKRWEAAGFPAKTIAFNQSMPDNRLLIQGEYVDRTWNKGTSYLLYTKVKKPMNIALAEQTLHAEGLKARLLLKSNMSESSYEDLRALVEVFPENTVVEFSGYDTFVGNIPGRTMIVWEARGRY